MSKPWEKKWIQHPMDYRAVCELNPTDASESLVVADIRADEPAEVSLLIAAAPDMAHALLAMLEAFPAASASREEYEARAEALRALAKAGVSR